MNRFNSYIAVIAALVVLFASGCGYFNTFYNARRQFADAERDTRAAEKQARRQQQQQTPPPPGNPGTPPTGGPVTQPPGQQGAGADKYRKVIETSSRMLEDYPKSRWADDALFIMGVSYFRLGDMVRAERKFTELITLFPGSRYIPEATVWKAKTLAGQKKKEDAVELLQTGLPLMKSGPQKARALFLMGSLCYDLERFADAAGFFKKSADMNQPRDERTNALYYFGLTQFAQNDYESARDAFAEVARTTRDTPQAYDSWIRCSHCEVALHNFDNAEAILKRLNSGERFLDYAEDVPLELAKLAVEAGRVEDGMRLYQDFIDQHSNGARRGLAFYRLALIHRDQKADLPTAKSLLDSSGKSGASRDVADSARAALDQISKGLLAMERIKSLQENIQHLEAKLDSIGVPREAMTVSALLAHEDSIRQREVARKPARPKAPETRPSPSQPDSTALAGLQSDTSATPVHSPAVTLKGASSDTLNHLRKTAPHPSHKDSAVTAAPEIASSHSTDRSVPSMSIRQRKISLLDSNLTWNAARVAFRSISLADRFGLRTLTRAIETRDSARGEGNDEHVHRVQGVINRAYGIGTMKSPVSSDSSKQPAILNIPPLNPRTPALADSAASAKVPGEHAQKSVKPAPAPAKDDTTATPSVPVVPGGKSENHILRGYRSTPESPGQAPPDSGKKPVFDGSAPPNAPGASHEMSPMSSSAPITPVDTAAIPAVPPDSARKDTVQATARPDSGNATLVPSDPEPLRNQLLAKRRELQLAYLHAAEFYEFNLSEQDSALTYFRLAASSPVNANVYWRANLYLGSAYSQKPDSMISDSSRPDSIPESAAAYYRVIIGADSVPVSAANAARAALKMPLIEIPVPPQLSALRAAEQAQFVTDAPNDSIINLYSRVIAMDSTSKEGKKALFAKASLLEMRLHHYDQARAVYERLLTLDPDTAMVNIARAKLTPPDSNSIFNKSDAELAGKHEAVEALLDSKQDDSGWPPSEESLRGRHYH